MSKIIGQDKLIKEVNRIFQVFVNSNCKIRPHFILTGESGSGKSFTIKQLCDMNELSFLEVNAAQITKEGISGNSLSKILSPLVNYSHTPIVVFVDEFDKLFINGNTNSQLANESTASVQNEFLKLLESDTTSVFGDYGKYISVPIDNVLFVFAGAFNNEPHITLDRLRDFGVKTEFLGRVGLIYNTKPLTLEDLYSILECSDLLQNYLDLFFNVNREQVISDLKGYLPIRIKALPEGSVCPIRVPMMTITNTLPEFFWLTNYLETIISCTLWMPCTSATRARLYKKELHRHACKTGFPTDVNLGFCCHDFSMRGMAGMEAAIISGMAHMTSFVGSETIPAIAALEEYYGANSDEELIAATVPATEHSVMCAGGEEDELGTFKRLINDLYPSGFVSIVSDTWDFWNVIENFLPKLKKDIMARDGRVVIRPDSGDPVDIICGLRTNPHFNTRMKEGKYYCCYAPFNDDAEYVEVSEGQYYGAYYMLGKIFGWNTTSKDYRYPSTKVGLLYGDSITLERQKQIYLRLENAHMAACNLVLGVGSYSYQYASRDSLGFAIKATACVVNGELKEIFKHPKTDDGTKNSLKGLIAVYKCLDGKYTATDQVSIEEEKEGCLETVFEDGILKKEYSLEEIRQRIDHGL